MLAGCTIEEAREKFSAIPDRLLESLYKYFEYGCPTGGFLHAVLSNDLCETFGRADEESRLAVFDILTFLYNYAPASCWGSPETVKVWKEDRLAERKEEHNNYAPEGSQQRKP